MSVRFVPVVVVVSRVPVDQYYYPMDVTIRVKSVLHVRIPINFIHRS